MSNGNYEVIVDRLGFVSDQRSAILNNSHINNFNFTLQYFIVGIEHNGEEIPGSYSLRQNYPNPFNPSTTIDFALPTSSKVIVLIYDILGREVETLLNENFEAGHYSVRFDGSRLASGVYFYKFCAGDFVQYKKMVIIK